MSDQDSFAKIDYSLRPAKHAERRMLLHVFRKMAGFDPLEHYGYVGFGSVWFADFVLMHRAVGVKDLISMERAKYAEERFRANLPFNAINLRFDDSNTVLPELDWSKRRFLWLDYDDPITPNILRDVRTVALKARSGTMLAVSVNGHRAREFNAGEGEPAPADEDVVARFKSNFGRSRIEKASVDDLIGWPFAALSRDLIDAEIEDALSTRQTTHGEDFRCTNVCEIEYQDGAKMTTSVRVLSSAAESEALERCELNRLDFLPEGKSKVRIEVPKLTLREIRALEQQLPRNETFNHGLVPKNDADALAQFYRYLPNFAVLET